MRTARVALTVCLVLIGACSDGVQPTSVDPPSLTITANSSVRITPSLDTISAGNTRQLSTVLTDDDGNSWTGKYITWSSSNPSVATVSSSGLLTGVASGSATITATTLSMGSGTLVMKVLAGSPPPATKILHGLHMDLTWQGWANQRAAAVSRAKAVNTQVSRNGFLWHKIERQRGARDWSIPDAVVNELRASGIEPLFVVWGSPSWANGVSSTTANYWLYVPTADAAFRAWLDKYKAFIRDAALRYKGRVKRWELWNEENQVYCWKPVPNIGRYAQWYREIYATIKSVDPAAQVALGGLTGLSVGGTQDITGKAFLQGLYSRGVYPDIVAIHPYAMKQQAPDVTLQWENNFTDIGMIHNVMVAAGQGSKPIWITEWGWSTAKVSETTQATYVRQAMQLLATKYTYVKLSTYFLDFDRSGYYSGLYASNFRMKPAGAAFRDYIAAYR